MKTSERFLEYVMWDTMSKSSDTDGAENAENADRKAPVPSTLGQTEFAKHLLQELKNLGIADVTLDEKGYIYGMLPSNLDEAAAPVPTIGFLAHMDTSEAHPGPSANKPPRVIKNYDGRPINLSGGPVLDPAEHPALAACKGQDIIVTDGTTLLGGDDKAGVAEIVTALACLLDHPEIPHGKIAFSFTPDEEIGTSQDNFDVKAFGADFAYTVDGGPFGEIEFENFYAASAVVTVKGVSTHPGEAKDKMKNALQIGMEFDRMLPPWERPEHTSGYEGFYHLEEMTGDCENSRMVYLIREHDIEKFAHRKAVMNQIADLLSGRYGGGTVKVAISDTYRNMAEKVRPHMHLIDYARAAIRELGAEPVTNPIRGGTDGSELSYKGVPCPNLGTGSFNHHSVSEVASIDQMEKCTQLIIKLAEMYGRFKG